MMDSDEGVPETKYPSIFINLSTLIDLRSQVQTADQTRGVIVVPATPSPPM